jgi:cytochrome c-type biogenesis protein
MLPVRFSVHFDTPSRLIVDSPGIPLAFAAGLVSFLSPCCLPLVPGYLAAVSGTAAPEPATGVNRSVLARSLLFVATFSVIFVMLGLRATALGVFLLRNQPALNKVASGAIAAMGILFVASVFVARLNADWRPQALLQKAGRGGPVVAGAAFAVAWTPCIGLTLGAILGLAATQRSAPQGALLLAVYSSGLAMPFLLVGGRLQRPAARLHVLQATLREGPGRFRSAAARHGRPGHDR